MENLGRVSESRPKPRFSTVLQLTLVNGANYTSALLERFSHFSIRFPTIEGGGFQREQE